MRAFRRHTWAKALLYWIGTGINAVLRPARMRLVYVRPAPPRAMRPAKFTETHLASCTVLPSREALLQRMPKHCVVAECGVADGAFSQKIIDLCQPRQLILNDSWSSPRFRSERLKVDQRFSTQIAAGTVVIHHGHSLDVLANIPAGSLDWVYIDTDHSYETTLAELRCCDQAVASGGRIAGHDFTAGNPRGAVTYGVIPAVQQFCAEAGWVLEYLTLEQHGHFSFCLRRQPNS